MKSFYTLVFFLSFSAVSIAQTYTPFLAEGKIWIENYYADYTTEGWECDSPPGQNNECLTRYYVLNGDTMLDGNSYKIMWRRIRDNNPYVANNEYGPFNKVAYLRENQISRKVFIHETSSILFETCLGTSPEYENNEMILYDFSLSINDTLKHCYYEEIINNKRNEKVVNGDSLMVFNSLYQEGLGNFYGPVQSFSIVEYRTTNLQCVYLNGEAIYGSCSPQLLNVKHNSNETAELKIYPNQVEDKLTLISGVNQTINIYDILGNVVHSEPISKGETVIDLHFLARQLYIVKGDAVSKKIVKL